MLEEKTMESETIELPILSRDEIVEAVRDCVRAEEIELAKGNRSNHWFYARAWYKNGKIEIHTGCEVSPCYPESEYYGKGSHPPVTFWTAQTCYSPCADDGLEWNVSDWKDGEYIGKIHPKYHSCFESSKYFCMDQIEDAAEKIGLDIDGKSDDEIHAVFETAGWKPFTLGDPVEEPDVEDAMKEAVDSICESWDIE